ncbi:hypothetical protein L2725_01670 [Shewanella corallii]|uniref:DUF998 domain-containing protein n=2 Tax=Shewanella TaxID=22 RepID=A0ABT0N3Z0_9GAMM|nr:MULTISPECIES: hypothetical protein [Shewanella]MCL1035877.1 hypothetical protein [Shewanella submarina]MCL2912502.1 hypothetical protein [Shewanella corallii]
MYARPAPSLGQYDLHHLIIFLMLTGAFVATAGLVLTVGYEYLCMGLKVFALRANQLGDYRLSQMAYVINGSTLSYGMCTLMGMFGLYQLKLDNLSKLMAMTGGWMGLSILLIGIYPLNYLEQHRFWSTSVLFSCIILCIITIVGWLSHKRYCTRGMTIVSILLFLGTFAILLQVDLKTLQLQPCPKVLEPHFCSIALNSWAMCILSIIWDVLLALNMRKLVIQDYQALSLRHLRGE